MGSRATKLLQHQQNSKLGKWGGYLNYKKARIDSSYPKARNPHNGSRPMKVIRETQLFPKIINQ